MSGVNKVILIGRLGQDPEVKFMQSGTAVCNFSMATSETWKDKESGEKQEKTEWHKITAWRRLAEICGEYLHKGSQVYIDGKLQTRSWEDQDGNKRWTTEIVAAQMQMLSGGGQKDNGESGRDPSAKEPQSQGEGSQDINIPEDDIPF